VIDTNGKLEKMLLMVVLRLYLIII